MSSDPLLPFVSSGTICPDPEAHFLCRCSKPSRRYSSAFRDENLKRRIKQSGASKTKWRPPPCKANRRTVVQGPSCSVCFASDGGSLHDLKGMALYDCAKKKKVIGFFLIELNSSIQSLDKEIRDQRLKVIDDLRKMDKGRAWKEVLQDNNSGVEGCTCGERMCLNEEPPEKSDSLKCIEDLSKKPIKFIDAFESNSDVSLKKLRRGTGSRKPHKTRRRSGGEGIDDYYIGLLVEELKRENRDLKDSLIKKESRLEEAARKIEDIVRQNSDLTRKIKLIAFEEEDEKEKTQGPSKKVNDKELSLLRQKLTESEVANRNLQTYIEYLKKSYISVFGSVAITATSNSN